MTATEQDIYTTPAMLRPTLARVDERGAVLASWLQGPAVFLGCGSSYCIALAAAALYEDARGVPAQGIMASEYRPRPEWTHVAISRTGKTTELVEAMRRARAAGARVALVGGEPDAPAQEQADAVLPLEFASEQGVIQTRFISAATLALRLLVGGEGARWRLGDLPGRVEQGLAAFDPPDDAASAAVLDDVRRTRATVCCTGDDPLVAAAQAQLLAVRMAEARGVDPDAPRHLRRAIVLPSTQ